MATRMLQRRGTSAEWAAQNPVLSPGEIGFETDTKMMKIGDGVTNWNSLIGVNAGTAATADHADTADLATLATNATNADNAAMAADSQLLDGLDSSQFMRSDAAATYTQTANFNADLAAVFGDSDTDKVENRAVQIETHQRSTDLTYTNDVLTQVVEKSGGTTVRTTVLNYTNGVLTSTVETAGGKTITTTLNYNGANLIGTTRTVS